MKTLMFFIMSFLWTKTFKLICEIFYEKFVNSHRKLFNFSSSVLLICQLKMQKYSWTPNTHRDSERNRKKIIYNKII